MGGKGRGRKRKVKGKGRGGGRKEGGALEKFKVKPRARKAAIRPCIDFLLAYIRRSWAADLAHTKILAWRPYEIKAMCQAEKKRM